MPRGHKYKERCHWMIKFISESKFWSIQAFISPRAGIQPSVIQTKGRGSAEGHTQGPKEELYMTSYVTVPYSCSWLQSLLSVLTLLAVATGHLSSPLLFFPDQVTYPGRIRPRLCTLHSFLTSFLFSIPGGSWTVSSLACKCICASSLQWSMSVWTCFSSSCFPFCFPCCLRVCPLCWPCGAIVDWSSGCQILFPRWRQK